MAYKASVTSTVRLATTNTVSANLGATMFIATYFGNKNRTTSYSSMQEVRDDITISKNGNFYKAALTFFSQVGAAVPMYLGRRTADDITFTPTTVSNTAEYAFDIEVYDEDTQVGTSYSVSITSDATATATEIATALYTEVITTQAIPNLTGTDNTGSVTFVPAAGYSFVITNTTTNLTESYTTTETAATVFSAVLEEAEDDFYFVVPEDKTEAFILALATEVEATGSGDFPKQLHFSTDDANTLVALTDPATDLLGKVKEGNYDLTAGYWSHEANIFPEMSSLAIMGSLVPGTSNWKFLQPAAVEAARDPVTDKVLTTAKQGYIKDRNASWLGVERGVTFTHGGTMASGEFVDVIRTAHYINDQIETRLLNLFLNKGASGDKISFLAADQKLVLDTINGVLTEGVSRKQLTGYIPASITVAPSFSDQATRTLDDVKWVGYLAGAVNFVLVDGTLTYADEALA